MATIATTTETERKYPGLRQTFKYMNRFMMVPLLRLGLVRWMASPPTGYIMLLRTVGRKSGKVRETPLNYAILDGNVYCMSGFGRGSHWFTNLQANPRVEVVTPVGAFSGLAEEVLDEEEARRVRRAVARAAGFALLFEGLNPVTVSDEQLDAKLEGIPMVRVRPTGIAAGPYDPGGLGWVFYTLAQVAALVWLVARRRRRATTR